MSEAAAHVPIPSRDASIFRGGRRAIPIAAGAGVVGWIATAIGFALLPDVTLHAYLTNWAYFTGLALGALCWLMAFQAAKSIWIVVVRRLLEVMASTLSLCTLLFIPVIVGMHKLYPWVDRDPARGAHFLYVTAHQHQYLNPTGWVMRALVFLVLWSSVSAVLLRWSRMQDSERLGVDRTLLLTLRQRQLAAVAMPFVGVAFTFAAFDWLMSLEPTYRSTVFGLYWFSGGFVGAMALLIACLHLARGQGYFAGLVNTHHLHALGKLLFAFVCFWAYIAFAQYLLTWIANLPESEIPYYLLRQRHGWQAVSIFLAAGHFFVPFFILLSQDLKKRWRSIAAMGFWILFAHWVDTYWLVMPFVSETPRLHWQDLATFLAVGGPLVAFGLFRLRNAYLAPVGDPYLEDSIAFRK